MQRTENRVSSRVGVGCLYKTEFLENCLRRGPLFVAAVTVCGLSVPPGVVFANDSLGKSWPASQQVSMDQISYSQFDTLLQKYVDDDGFVDYTAWHASRTDRQALKSCLDGLSRASMSQAATKDGQLAFWINAYNAVTIEGILQEYPTSSIRNHTARLVGYNIWDDLPLIVGGREFRSIRWNTTFSARWANHGFTSRLSVPRLDVRRSSIGPTPVANSTRN